MNMLINYFNNCPKDIIKHITTYLTANELMVLACTSKFFNSISNDDTRWEPILKLYSGKYAISPQLSPKQNVIRIESDNKLLKKVRSLLIEKNRVKSIFKTNVQRYEAFSIYRLNVDDQLEINSDKANQSKVTIKILVGPHILSLPDYYQAYITNFREKDISVTSENLSNNIQDFCQKIETIINRWVSLTTIKPLEFLQDLVIDNLITLKYQQINSDSLSELSQKELAQILFITLQPQNSIELPDSTPLALQPM